MQALVNAIEINNGQYPNYVLYDLQIHCYLEKLVDLVCLDKNLCEQCLNVVPSSAKRIEYVLKFIQDLIIRCASSDQTKQTELITTYVSKLNKDV